MGNNLGKRTRSVSSGSDEEGMNPAGAAAIGAAAGIGTAVAVGALAKDSDSDAESDSDSNSESDSDSDSNSDSDSDSSSDSEDDDGPSPPPNTPIVPNLSEGESAAMVAASTAVAERARTTGVAGESPNTDSGSGSDSDSSSGSDSDDSGTSEDSEHSEPKFDNNAGRSMNLEAAFRNNEQLRAPQGIASADGSVITEPNSYIETGNPEVIVPKTNDGNEYSFPAAAVTAAVGKSDSSHDEGTKENSGIKSFAGVTEEDQTSKMHPGTAAAATVAVRATARAATVAPLYPMTSGMARTLVPPAPRGPTPASNMHSTKGRRCGAPWNPARPVSAGDLSNKK